MKKIYILFTFVIITSVSFSQSNPSCVDFSQTSVDLLNSNDFLPDGRFNSARLAQGDKIEMYKPFYKSRTYMIVVSCEETLPGVIVEVKDMARNVILSSYDPNVEHEFVYTPDKNQNLIISVEVQKSPDMPASNKGCVSVVVGFK